MVIGLGKRAASGHVMHPLPRWATVRGAVRGVRPLRPPQQRRHIKRSGATAESASQRRPRQFTYPRPARLCTRRGASACADVAPPRVAHAGPRRRLRDRNAEHLICGNDRLVADVRLRCDGVMLAQQLHIGCSKFAAMCRAIERRRMSGLTARHRSIARPGRLSRSAHDAYAGQPEKPWSNRP